MKKKILVLFMAFAMLFSTLSVAMAAPLDLIHKTDTTKNYEFTDFLHDTEVFNYVGDNMESYVIEAIDGNYYNVDQVNAKIDEGAEDFADAIKDLEPVELEKPEDGLEVVEVSAINNSQIRIEFNQKVTRASAENPSNYYIGITENVTKNMSVGYTPRLQADGKTVIITTDNLDTNTIWEDLHTDGLNALSANDGTNVVVKNKTAYVQIKDIYLEGNKLADAVQGSFVAEDLEGPKFASTTFEVEPGATTFEVQFNEPVVFDSTRHSELSSSARFYLNGTDVTNEVEYSLAPTNLGTDPLTVAEYSTLVVDFDSAGVELEDGNNTFEVVGLQDFAGNATSPNRITTTIKYAAEQDVTVTAPKFVKLVQVHDGAFQVHFDKAVDGGKIIIKNLKNDNVDEEFVIGTDANLDPSELDSEGNQLPVYLVEFDTDSDYTTDEVYNGANDIIRTVEVKDYYITHPTTSAEVKGVNHSKAYKFVKDNKAPVVKDYDIVSNDVVVEFEDAPFNGNIVAGTDGNVIVKYVEDGITYTYTVPTNLANNLNTADNTLALGLTAGNAEKLFKEDGSTIKPGITFTVKLPYGLVTDDRTDATPQYNGPFAFIGDTITVTTPGEAAGGEVVPQTSQAGISFDDTENVIEIVFVGENIDPATATNKANYTFDGSALPTGTTIEYSEAGGVNTVYIYLPDNSVVRNGNYTLSIKNVATKSGAKMLPTDVVVYGVTDNTQPVMTSAKVTSDNRVEVTFDETLSGTTTGTAADTGDLLGDITDPTLNADRNFKVIINGVKYNVATVEAKTSRTLVLTTVDTFDYSNGVKVELALDASDDMFIEDIAGNAAAERTITATIDIEE